MTSAISMIQVFTKAWTTADISQFSAFAAIFDQYKIDLIEVFLEPYGPATAPGYTANTKWYSVVDYDDTIAPTSVAQLQEYENCTTSRVSYGHQIAFKPHNLVAVASTAFNQNKNVVASWIDTTSTTAIHLGLKVLLDATTAAGDAKVDMFTRIHVSFRNVI